MNKDIAREVKDACDWFYTAYPRPNPDTKVYAYKWRISFRLAHLLHIHTWDFSDANSRGTYSGHRHIIIVYYNEWSKLYRLRSLFHELIHAQQQSLDRSVFEKSSCINAGNDPLEEKACSISTELVYCYLHDLPPVYLNPMPCSGVISIAVRLQEECPRFKLME
jgi:hypothetical protein